MPALRDRRRALVGLGRVTPICGEGMDSSAAPLAEDVTFAPVAPQMAERAVRSGPERMTLGRVARRRWKEFSKRR
jgi:hypothetical protein